jgi:putative tryptophan/tyrosine transport system substrate-binding protein
MTMQRREFLTLFGGAAAVWPVAAWAQQPAMLPIIGYLSPGTPEGAAAPLPAFRQGLSEAGFVEGRNITIEYRWARGDLDRLPELAADLVRRPVSVIVTSGTPAALAAKAATITIPIVFGLGSDPVQFGLVASLNRPGGNATGVIDMDVELVGKRLGILHELLPNATGFALLVNPASSIAETVIRSAQTAAAAVGRKLEVFDAGSNRDIDIAFASLVQNRMDAVLVGPDPLFNERRVQIVSLAARHAVPAIYPSNVRDFVEVGGLMSYGSNNTDRNRQIGIYAARILKGEKPADLPVMRPTKFQFIINLQTAKLLNIVVPPTLLAVADEVIE